MIKRTFLNTYPFILFLFISNQAMAQRECSFTLDSARNLFESGIIEDIPQVLAPCMEDGFSREQKISAYKLIIMSYLFDDNQEGAENIMLEFLDDFPNYEIRPDDAVEFVYLFESYQAVSVFSVGFFMGPNLTATRTIEPYSMTDINNKNKNKIGASTLFGIRLNRYLYKRIEANAEIFYSNHKYEFIKSSSGNKEVNYSESLTTWEVPLYISYDFNVGKWVPFAYAGTSLGFITSAKGTANQVSVITDGQPTAQPPGPERNILDRRNLVNFSLFAGGGLKYKMPQGYIGIDLRFNAGLNDIVKNIKSDQLEMTTYGYIDNRYALNRLFITVGYHYTLYRPTKIR